MANSGFHFSALTAHAEEMRSEQWPTAPIVSRQGRAEPPTHKHESMPCPVPLKRPASSPLQSVPKRGRTNAGTAPKLNQANPASRGCNRVGRKTKAAQGVDSPLTAQIFAALKALPAEERRQVLTHQLSQRQRVALEAWALSQRSMKASTHVTTGRHGECPSTTCAEELKAHQVQRACKQPLSASGASGYRGITITAHKHPGGVWYKAKVSAAPFLLHSRKDRDLATVKQFLPLLAAIGKMAVACVGNVAWGEPNGACTEQCSALALVLRQEIHQELQLHGMDAEKLGLRILVEVPSKPWVGRMLATPSFTLAELDQALNAMMTFRQIRGQLSQYNRHSLLAHHSPLDLALAWQRLRAAYVDVCVRAGHRRDEVEAKLETKEKQHQPLIQRRLALWQIRQSKLSGVALEHSQQNTRKDGSKKAGSSLKVMLRKW
eukprot:CAMPEP_0178422424 /NCGR_PEP_ID=MMETSP0689_2-20121128/27167_1 /TAXON_ID=160604 /ORGANISM="Amphidinium massartii, Strain CS-259" /LENGTH=433 /DNA_ID=CAMNT_0020043989 /DNA_START=206 /DNA_END=1504 /DNA_ORIENTATION=+